MSRKPECDYDIVVAGGGAGGVGAALGAALEGADVLLVEKYGFLGGAATTSNVLAYCGFFQQGETPIKAVGGVADLVLDELCSLGLDCNPFCFPTTLNWIINLLRLRAWTAADGSPQRRSWMQQAMRTSRCWQGWSVGSAMIMATCKPFLPLFALVVATSLCLSIAMQ